MKKIVTYFRGGGVRTFVTLCYVREGGGGVAKNIKNTVT